MKPGWWGGGARLAGWTVRWGGQPDLDMASTVAPADYGGGAAKAGLAVYETGLAHGTITLKDDQDSIELTQTRRDMNPDGRHAEVQPTDDWAEDAARRDFTVNAIYLDRDGQLFDPCGGQADLAAGRLCFIGGGRAQAGRGLFAAIARFPAGC